ncbi:MAG: Holliday junction resolvase RuvX [bacterium]|nr:Holliday junction resolvase RuvX [bacterium]
MNRVMGLDIGTKRIGIALSDPLLITAQPFDTIDRTPEKTALEKIENIVKEYNVNKVIAGLPLMMNGDFGEQAQDCKDFGEKVSQKTQIDVIFIDERLTSFQAEEILKAQKAKYTKNKGLVDKIAASIILQEYLDSL